MKKQKRYKGVYFKLKKKKIRIAKQLLTPTSIKKKMHLQKATQIKPERISIFLPLKNTK